MPKSSSLRWKRTYDRCPGSHPRLGQPHFRQPDRLESQSSDQRQVLRSLIDQMLQMTESDQPGAGQVSCSASSTKPMR